VDSTRRRPPSPATPARVGFVLIVAAAGAVALVVFTDAPGPVDVVIVLACAVALGVLAGRLATRVRDRRRG
jgi:hypothetical protein